MNTYGAIWNSKEAVIEAETTYAAQQAAVAEFKKVAGRKKVRGSDIHVRLMSKNGEAVVHVADF